MKIGIITLYRNHNYGAVLQAYALQTVIKKSWPNCETIKYFREINGVAKKPRPAIISSAVGIVRSMISNKTFNFITYTKLQRKINFRNSLFDDFINKYISESEKVYIGHRDLKDLNAIYDVFIAGSDNIWNKNLLDSAFFLDFADDEKGKMSYAAGMSYESADSSVIDFLKPLLNRLDFISVREPTGKTFVESIINKTVFRALDPTLLLTRDEWEKIEKPVNLKEKSGYILCFFIEPTELMVQETILLRELTGKMVVCLPMLHQRVNPAEMKYADCCLFNVGPGELISLVRQADFVCTDSFHGTVFSVIFNKQFACFRRFHDERRSSLNLRMDHLLNLLGIPNRIVESPEDIKSLYSSHVEYESINKHIEELRNESIEYLYGGIKSFDKV